MWNEHEGMQNALEIWQQNASQQPTLMQPTCILAHHSAYLQAISSIDTSKENPSMMMMTSPMPMPYVGVLWWNPPCVRGTPKFQYSDYATLCDSCDTLQFLRLCVIIHLKSRTKSQHLLITQYMSHIVYPYHIIPLSISVTCYCHPK